MSDPILEVGGAGIETTDAKVRALMSNIVNSETPGYKRTEVVTKAFPTYLEEAKIRSSSQIPQVETVKYDQTPGTLLRTGNKLDIAIGGDGFFVVETPSGRGYTRDGRFTLNRDGNMVTVAGNHPVVGEGGVISVPAGSDLTVNASGDIIVNGVKENRFKIVAFEDTSVLEPVTGSLFRSTSPGKEKDIDLIRVVQGYVEASNVNIVDTMMEMVYLNRLYGLDTKIISNRDQMMTKAIGMGGPAQ